MDLSVRCHMIFQLHPLGDFCGYAGFAITWMSADEMLRDMEGL